MWHNCLTFNPPGDPVTMMCCAVRQRFNALWRDAALPLTPAPPAAAQPRGAQAAPLQQPLAASRAARAPPPSQYTRAGGSEFEYKWRYPPQTQAAAPAQAPQEEYETSVPHAVLKKLKVYHAPSAALNGQDLAIKVLNLLALLVYKYTY